MTDQENGSIENGENVSEENLKANKIEKIKSGKINSTYNSNLKRAKTTSDLLKAKELIQDNIELYSSNSPNLPENGLSIMKEEIKKIDEMIYSLNTQIEQGLKNFTLLFDSQNFKEARDLIISLKKIIKSNGLVDSLEKSDAALKKADENILILSTIEKYSDSIDKNILDADVLRKYYSLKTISEKIDSSIHPFVKDSVQKKMNIYFNYLNANNIEITELTVGKKVNNWLKNRKENTNIKKENNKFKKLLSEVMKWDNLAEAQEKLTTAQNFIKLHPNVISKDNIDKYDHCFEETTAIIEELNAETQRQLNSTKELLKSFYFIEASSQIQYFLEKLNTYQITDLIEKINKQNEVCQANLAIFTNFKSIEKIFKQNDYLGAFKAMKDLLKEIESKEKIDLILQSLHDEIDEFSKVIDKSREEGEQILRNELIALKTQVMEQLNIDIILNQVKKQKLIAEKQEYSNFLKQHSQFVKELTGNQELYNEFKKISGLLSDEKYGEADKILSAIAEKLKKPEILYYSKLKDEIQSTQTKFDEIFETEKTKINKKIEQISKLLNENLDIGGSNEILKMALNRVNSTGLKRLTTLLEGSKNQIQLNQEAIKEQLDVQSIFSEGDIKEAYKECKKLGNKLSKGSKKFGYSTQLISSVKKLKEQIEIGLKDGVEKLESDFTNVQTKINSTQDFSEIIDLLTNYEIRATRLGLESKITEIHIVNVQCQRNQQVMNEYRLLDSKYENLDDFAETLKQIKNLYLNVAVDEQIFPHVLKAVEKLENKVSKGSKERETRMKQALDSIIHNELNVLNFELGKKSLENLKQTAIGLVVKEILPEIKKYIDICNNHQKLLFSLEDITNKSTQGNLIEAKRMIAGLQTAVFQYKGIIITPMRNKIDEMAKIIENQLSSEITSMQKRLKELVLIIENKKAESIYEELLALQKKAKYFGKDAIDSEIENLIKLCYLQFSPALQQKLKKQAAKEKNQVSTTFASTESKFNEEGTLIEKYVPATLKYSIPIIDEDIVPEFKNLDEKRDFKRKVARNIRVKVHKPPKVEENLNNSVRSSFTRQKLQKYSRQINKPEKRNNTEKCFSCGAQQKTPNEKFCFFCGKTIH